MATATAESHDSTSDGKDDLTLYDLVQNQFGATLAKVDLSRNALPGMVGTLGKTIIEQALPVMALVNYQRLQYWQQEAQYYLKDLERLHLWVTFVTEPTDETAQLDDTTLLPHTFDVLPDMELKETIVTLPLSEPLHRDWFLVLLTPRFSLVICGKHKEITTETETTPVYDTIISFEPTVVEYALKQLHGTLQQYNPAIVPQFEEGCQLFPPVSPEPYYLSMLATQFIGQVNHYRQMLRQLDQQQAMRATIARLIHDASQPVTTLVSLLDFAQHQNGLIAGEIDILLGAANQLKQILDNLREVNHFRTSKVAGSDYLDIGNSF